MCVSVHASLLKGTFYSIYPAARGAGRRAASSGAEPPARRGVADGSVADVLQRDRASRAMCLAAARGRLQTVATSTRAARACGGGGVGRHVSSICCSSGRCESSGERSGGCSEAAATAAAARVRELYLSVVLAGMAEAQRELGLRLAGLDEGACTRDASAQAAARIAAAVAAARTTGRSPMANLEVRAR